MRVSLLALALPLAAAFSPSAPSLLAHRRPALSTLAGRSTGRVPLSMLSKEGIEAKASLLKVRTSVYRGLRWRIRWPSSLVWGPGEPGAWEWCFNPDRPGCLSVSLFR